MSFIEARKRFDVPAKNSLALRLTKTDPANIPVKPNLVNAQRFSACIGLTIRWRDFLDYKWICAPHSIGTDVEGATACVSDQEATGWILGQRG